jgi:hypothetical protein
MSRPRGPARDLTVNHLPQDVPTNIVDHQQIAWDLIGEWYTNRRRVRAVFGKLASLNRWDMALVVARIKESIDHVGWKGIEARIEERADAETDRGKEATL